MRILCRVTGELENIHVDLGLTCQSHGTYTHSHNHPYGHCKVVTCVSLECGSTRRTCEIHMCTDMCKLVYFKKCVPLWFPNTADFIHSNSKSRFLEVFGGSWLLIGGRIAVFASSFQNMMAFVCPNSAEGTRGQTGVRV